ncbi:hypothetical protein NUSPORA_00631 [Nucleospora cyclopteri]
MADSSDNGVYDVEKILKDRIVKGKKQYFIKWLGYPESECTWEYTSNIFCEDLKKDYEEAKKKSKKVVEKSGSKEKKFRMKITNEWDVVIKKVIGISRSTTGGLEVEYVTNDGQNGVCSAKEIHSKAPIRLLEFYEENLSFPE